VARSEPRLSDAALVNQARRRLFARADLRAAAALARERGTAARAVGGAVRDAFLAALAPRAPARRGDLDLAVPAAEARAFGEALAARLGARAIAVGVPPRRVFRIRRGGNEVDVFETRDDPDRDLLRRDFTVNAMAFDLASAEFSAPAAALGDLRSRRLAPPRPGVFLEDPVRVLRAARFLAELSGFHLARAARSEIRRAAGRLRAVAAERRLYELNRILSAPPAASLRALSSLEREGALAALVPRSTARERRRGRLLVGRLARPSPPVARLLLLVPLGPSRAGEVLRRWKTPRRERRLANRLFALAPAAGRRPRAGPVTRREIVEVIRAVSPFLEEASLFLSAFGDGRSRRFARALDGLGRDRARRGRILRPARPVTVSEVAAAIGADSGPELGRALAALDLSLAAGDVRSRTGALRLLAARSRPR